MVELEELTKMFRVAAGVNCSVANRAIYAAAERDREEARADLGDKAAEAALAGNPKRARYFEEWADRV